LDSEPASSNVESWHSHTEIDRKLEDICRDLALLEKQGKAEGFFNNVENVDKLGSFAEDIRDAMMEYQVWIHD
jgi:hypothetical protein